jgi:hypothetical protein
MTIMAAVRFIKQLLPNAALIRQGGRGGKAARFYIICGGRGYQAGWRERKKWLEQEN